MENVINYKPLETSFKTKGFDYKQLDRVGNVALFEQTKEGLSGTWYEVVVVQQYGERVIAGVTITPTEATPPASSWGKHGWTFRNKIRALVRFGDLVSAETVSANCKARLSEVPS